MVRLVHDIAMLQDDVKNVLCAKQSLVESYLVTQMAFLLPVGEEKYFHTTQFIRFYG